MLPGPPKTMSPDVGAGGIELKGQAFRGDDCLCGGEWEVASSFKSASLAGELEDEGAIRILLRLAFFEAAKGSAPPPSPPQSLLPERLQKELVSRPNPLDPGPELSSRQSDRSRVEGAWRTRLSVSETLPKQPNSSHKKLRQAKQSKAHNKAQNLYLSERIVRAIWRNGAVDVDWI